MKYACISEREFGRIWGATPDDFSKDELYLFEDDLALELASAGCIEVDSPFVGEEYPGNVLITRCMESREGEKLYIIQLGDTE